MTAEDQIKFMKARLQPGMVLRLNSRAPAELQLEGWEVVAVFGAGPLMKDPNGSQYRADWNELVDWDEDRLTQKKLARAVESITKSRGLWARTRDAWRAIWRGEA